LRYCFTAQASEAFAAKGDYLAADLDLENIVECLVAEDKDSGAGDEAQRAPAAQALGIIVLGLAD